MTYTNAGSLADGAPLQRPMPTQDMLNERQAEAAQSPQATAQNIKNEYSEIKRQILKHHLLDKQVGYYARRISINLILLALSVTILITVDNLWVQLGNALLMAFVYVQISFLAHNSGHRQVGRTAKQDEMITLLHMGLLVGLSPSWWVDKHNDHHGHPNVEDMDPDIDFPILAFTPEKAYTKRGISRFIINRQAFFYPFLIMFISYSMRVQSVMKLFGKIGLPVRHPFREGAVMLVNWTVYIGGLLLCLGFWPALAFMLIHNAAIGLYIASVFAANHKGMPIMEKEHELTFLRLQILTARNVRAHPLTDFLYGGLNYQIEHHLFPTMPQNMLPKAQKLVKAFCAERGIPYYETGFIQSQKEVLMYLHGVSKLARQQSQVARVEVRG